MKKWYSFFKTRNGLTIISVGLLLSAFGILQVVAKDSVQEFLKRKLPKHVVLAYDSIQINLLTASVTFDNIDVRFLDKTQHTETCTTKITSLQIKNFSYLQFFFNNTIQVSDVTLHDPEFRYYFDKEAEEDPKDEKAENKAVLQLLKTIRCENVTIVNGDLQLIKQASKKDDTIVLGSFEDVEIQFKNLKTSPELIKNPIPLVFGEYHISTSNINYQLGVFEELKAKEVVLSREKSFAKQLSINSKYSKNELSKRLTTAKDHLHLEIEKVTLDNLDFGFEKEQFYVTTNHIDVQEPVLDIYRDQRLPATTTAKYLYSQCIREAAIQLDIPEIAIHHGTISYSERVESSTEIHPIFFANLEAKILHISNKSDPVQETTIAIKTDFMKKAPLVLDWSFDSSDESDAFLVSGSLQNFDTSLINPFFTSNLRVKANGLIHQLYYTISGNHYNAKGQLKMSYENFEFAVLRKDRLRINKLVSSIGKILINNGSQSDAKGFRYGTIDIERDTTKSFFNFLWKSMQDGLINTMVGNGKKAKS